VLLEGVDVLAAGGLGDKAVVVNGVDVLLARDCIAETSAGTVLVTDAPSLVAQRLFDVCPCVDVVVKSAQAMPIESVWQSDERVAKTDCRHMCTDHIPLGHLDSALWIAVLDDDHMVLLEEGAPHLQKLQVSDRGNDYV